MSFPAVGVDVVEIKRFNKKRVGARFLSNVFSKRELAYCHAFVNAAPHLAGTFAAKEAAAKALGGKDVLTSFEIRRNKRGEPHLWQRGKKRSSLAVSISHEGAYAVAVCIAV